MRAVLGITVLLMLAFGHTAALFCITLKKFFWALFDAISTSTLGIHHRAGERELRKRGTCRVAGARGTGVKQ